MPPAVNIPPASAADEVDPSAAPSSTEVQQPPAEAPAPAAATPPAGEAPTPTKPVDVTASVTKMLMDGKIDGVEAATNRSPDPSDTDLADEAAAPAAKPAKPAATPAPSAPPALELPPVPHPYDLPDDPTEKDLDGRSGEKTRVAFDRLRGRLRQQREEGGFGSMIIDAATAAQVDPDTVAAIVGLTLKAKSGDTKAATELVGVLDRLGIKVAPSAAPAPAVDAETLLEVEAAKVYKQFFAADVKSADMSEEKARARAREIAEERIKSRALSQPHTSIQTPQQGQQGQQGQPSQPAAQPQQPADGRPRLTALQMAASQKVNALAAQYTEAYKKTGADFAPVQKAAQAIVAEKVKRDGPINPMYWEYEFHQAVLQAQRKAATPAKPAAASTGMRPSQGTGGASGTSKNGFEKDIVSKLVSGRIDDL